MNEKGLSFEEALKRLEEIVNQLESSELSLEESLKLYEEGIQMSKFCQEKLNEIEGKLEKLTREDNGTAKIEPFSLND